MNLVTSKSVFSPFKDTIFYSNFEDTIQRFFDSGPSFYQRDKHLNVSETDTEFGIELAVPGLPKEDLEIVVSDDFLEIKVKHGSKEEKIDKHYHLRNLTKGSFQRKFQLPQNINRKGITAELENGLLNISLPKGKGEGVQKIKIS